MKLVLLAKCQKADDGGRPLLAEVTRSQSLPGAAAQTGLLPTTGSQGSGQTLPTRSSRSQAMLVADASAKRVYGFATHTFMNQSESKNPRSAALTAAGASC